MKRYCYLLTNKNKTVLYVGATNNLKRRIKEYKEEKYPNAFTKRYNCNKLVYFEEFNDVNDAF